MLNKVKSAFGGKKIFLAIILVLAFLVIGTSQTAAAKNEEPKLKVFVHQPKQPGKPVTLAMCTPTGNDQVNDYGLTPWHMLTSGVNYKINYNTKPTSLTNTQVSTAVSNSFATWTAADAKQIFKYGGTTSAQNARYDGNNAILWKPVSNSAIAITYIWYYPSTGNLAEVDTVFNKSLKWAYNNPTAGDCGGVSGKYDLQNIATHEFGHWIGLDDLYANVDKDLTMYGYGDLAELKKDTLGLGDITGVNAILP